MPAFIFYWYAFFSAVIFYCMTSFLTHLIVVCRSFNAYKTVNTANAYMIKLMLMFAFYYLFYFGVYLSVCLINLFV